MNNKTFWCTCFLARLKDLVELHVQERASIKQKSDAERQASVDRQEESGIYLDDVIIALDQRHTVAEQEIKAEYQVCSLLHKC